MNTEFTLSRHCEAIQIPSGKQSASRADEGVITQSLGGSRLTIATYQGLARIAEKISMLWVLNPRRNQLKAIYALQTAKSRMKMSGMSAMLRSESDC